MPMQQNSDGSWSPAQPLRGSWWVRLELKIRRWLKRRELTECICKDRDPSRLHLDHCPQYRPPFVPDLSD